jgi:hypothetical protein
MKVNQFSKFLETHSTTTTQKYIKEHNTLRKHTNNKMFEPLFFYFFHNKAYRTYVEGIYAKSMIIMMGKHINAMKSSNGLLMLIINRLITVIFSKNVDRIEGQPLG